MPRLDSTRHWRKKNLSGNKFATFLVADTKGIRFTQMRVLRRRNTEAAIRYEFMLTRNQSFKSNEGAM